MLNGRVDALLGSRWADRKTQTDGEWHWEILRAQFFAAERETAGGWARLRRPKVGLCAESEQKCFMCPDASVATEEKGNQPTSLFGSL